MSLINNLKTQYEALLPEICFKVYLNVERGSQSLQWSRLFEQPGSGTEIFASKTFLSNFPPITDLKLILLDQSDLEYSHVLPTTQSSGQSVAEGGGQGGLIWSFMLALAWGAYCSFKWFLIFKLVVFSPDQPLVLRSCLWSHNDIDRYMKFFLLSQYFPSPVKTKIKMTLYKIIIHVSIPHAEVLRISLFSYLYQNWGMVLAQNYWGIRRYLLCSQSVLSD